MHPRGIICSYKSSTLGVQKLSTAGVVLNPVAGVYLKDTASPLQTLAVQWEKEKKAEKFSVAAWLVWGVVCA